MPLGTYRQIRFYLIKTAAIIYIAITEQYVKSVLKNSHRGAGIKQNVDKNNLQSVHIKIRSILKILIGMCAI